MSPEPRPLSPVTPNQTAELFSGSEEEEEEDGMDTPTRSLGEREDSVGSGEGGGEAREGLKVFGDSQRKRPNPFKVSKLDCSPYPCI